MAKVFGIDLGTTHSLIAHCVDGVPRVIADTATGEILLPSVVAMPSGAPVVVGRAARRRLEEGEADTVASVKRLMGLGVEHLSPADRARYAVADGDGAVRLELGGRLHPPPEIAAYLLRTLKARAAAATGTEVRDVVITVPAYFNDGQRQATRDAGRLAGLDVLRLINEPTAAALAYGLDRRHDGLIAVYDLGGGTFDVCILRLERGLFQVLATHGDTHLGGDDIDAAIAGYLGATMQVPLGRAAASNDLQLRYAAEQLKIQLSTQEEAGVDTAIDGQSYRLTLGRDRLEELAAPLVERSLDSCRRALRDAGVKSKDLDAVLLVGGATRMPLVRRRVAELFDRPIIDDLNPDEVVALGAAAQAGALSSHDSDILLLDVVPLSLGIETIGGVMERLIERNTTVPAAVTQVFTTFVDNQTAVDLHVLQGERELAADNRSLARFKLTGLAPQPAGVPRVEVRFLIDVNGLLSVTASDPRSGREHGVEVKPTYGLGDDEIDRMLAASFTHASEDEHRRRLVDLRNQADSLLRGVRQALQRWAVAEEETPSVEKALEGLAMACRGEDSWQIQAAIDVLQQVTLPLAERVLAAAEGEPPPPSAPPREA